MGLQEVGMNLALNTVVTFHRLGKRKVLGGAALVGVAVYLAKMQAKQQKKVKAAAKARAMVSASDPKAAKVAVDKVFLRRLWSLVKIVIPGMKSKEFLLLLLHTGFLVSRTFASIYIARLDGAIVKTIVQRNSTAFMWAIAKWLAFSFPASYINSMIKFLESKLTIAFRTKMVEHVYSKYLSNDTYYRVGNLDSRLANADQCLTEDVSRFCGSVSHLYSHLSKPCLDVCLFSLQLYMMASRKLGSGSGIMPGVAAGAVITGTFKFLQWISPPFGKMSAELGHKEGQLRFVHSWLITNSEEIAFYRGHEIEKSVLERAYLDLVKHMNYIYRERIFYITVEDFFMKYLWAATGLCLVAIPSFVATGGTSLTDDVSTRTQDFVTSRGLLTKAADAVERIMGAYKEVNELAGYTYRVHQMIEVFDDVSVGKYEKKMVTDSQKKASKLVPGAGKLVEADVMKLEEVPVVSPNGDVLVDSLSLEIRPSMHLLITGPNGCGKSSLFRILGGLWPVFGGTVHKPKFEDMFYIPQKPYLTIGSLRDQVIYPETTEQSRAKGFTDDDLAKILDKAFLLHILEREGGWDAVNDWTDVLSGGEKQRIGMARLFYHKPHYAFLDECTSAVSIDVEGQMYQHAIDLGITLLTVTHRPSLWKFHNYLLQFDGEGGTKFSELNATARLGLKDEKSKLEQELSDVPKKQERLRELCGVLGEDSVVLKLEH